MVFLNTNYNPPPWQSGSLQLPFSRPQDSPHQAPFDVEILKGIGEATKCIVVCQCIGFLADKGSFTRRGPWRKALHQTNWFCVWNQRGQSAAIFADEGWDTSPPPRDSWRRALQPTKGHLPPHLLTVAHKYFEYMARTHQQRLPKGGPQCLFYIFDVFRRLIFSFCAFCIWFVENSYRRDNSIVIPGYWNGEYRGLCPR